MAKDKQQPKKQVPPAEVEQQQDNKKPQEPKTKFQVPGTSIIREDK